MTAPLTCRWCDRVTHDPAIVGSTALGARALGHVLPRSRNGAEPDPGDCVISCYVCHQAREALAGDEWTAVLIVRAEKAPAAIR